MAAAARIASSSAWAVGSRSMMVRLNAEAMRAFSRTMTQPIGTSPAACAARACSSARSMKEATLVLPSDLCYQPLDIHGCVMDRKSEDNGRLPGERIAKVMARAVLTSRREAED